MTTPTHEAGPGTPDLGPHAGAPGPGRGGRLPGRPGGQPGTGQPGGRNVSGGYPGDEPRRGGVRGGYGQEPPCRAADPRERDQPDEDTPRAGGGSGDLSDLWREPDPWAADARRGLDAWQGRAPPRERPAGPGGSVPAGRGSLSATTRRSSARAYTGDRERRDGQRYDEPGYRGGSTGRGAPRPGAGSRRDAPGPGAGLPEPGRLERPGPGGGPGTGSGAA